MRRIVFSGIFVLFCLLDDVGGLICRACNLSLPFHGCLLDYGICKTKPGQYCKNEIHSKAGIQWYSVKGCTETHHDCFKKSISHRESFFSHCCFGNLCNF
ncbi:uncharacterized protein C9orf57 homolog [Erinaceus europaeus]|uniref:Uncharacterized protein C9orf57 homolog n=1 Tax=Erinaceus europaeus TaxID=9365 RepID=A0ABM3Y2H4_ERIEU|nr:uncharacterized protein C9orf57 homolog [Erinaceus europaeus]